MAAPHQALLPLIRGEEMPPGVRITAQVVASAEEHGVAALLDHEVTRRDIDVGQELRTRLAMGALAVAAENQSAQAAAVSISETATDLDIDIAIFKGVAIGRRFYRNPSLRPTIDVDVFVNPAQVHRMGELFEALGSSHETRSAVETMVAEGRVFEESITVSGSTVDLHRDPMNMVLVSRLEQESWNSTIPFELTNGTILHTLGLEWSIVQALLHGFRDNFADLLHIYDLDLMFDDDPDWDRIATIAETEGWTDIIRFATAFVADALGRPSPLPRHIKRSSLLLIRRIWPNYLLLKGADSVVTSLRRQSALSLLTRGRRSELSLAYMKRIAPSRAVIDLRSQPSDDPYAVALYRWRREQRRTNLDMKDNAAMTEQVTHETF